MLTMRVTPKISDSPALTKKRLDAAASPLSAWNATASRVTGAAALDAPSPRLRGEGRGEGASPQAQTRGDAPSPGMSAKDALLPTSPRERGGVQAARRI